MNKKSNSKTSQDYSRRGFLKTGGAAAAGGLMIGCGSAQPIPAEPAEVAEQAPVEEKPHIKRTRTLGRTGFEVSDVSMGCGQIAESNVVRYAYDHGVNLFDVAETYGNGDSERKIGEALPHMDRSKIFVVTKLHLEEKDNEQTILDRFAGCQERLKTDYLDALYLHAVSDVKTVTHPGFHSAVAKLKADGRLKHAGISCHGPRGEGVPMSDILLAAVEDGRFDLMLLVHNFLKPEEGEKVLAACKEKNIGTTAMKTNAGQLEVEHFDPENPSEEFANWLKAIQERHGKTREEAVAQIQERLTKSAEEIAKNKPGVDAFRAKYGVNTQEEIDKASVAWVLDNENMHTVCVSMPTFDKIDQYLPVSGQPLTPVAARMLRDYELAFGHNYCRHGCNECAAKCPSGVPVSTVMRYSYYFSRQGREKYAMAKYAGLAGKDASPCVTCNAPCMGSCPYGVQIQAGLVKADAMLKLG